ATTPGPLKPLGNSIVTLLREKPFVGFMCAFVPLHGAYVLLTGALPYVPQTLLGLNSADRYHEYVTGQPVTIDDPVFAAAYGKITIEGEWKEFYAKRVGFREAGMESVLVHSPVAGTEGAKAGLVDAVAA